MKRSSYIHDFQIWKLDPLERLFDMGSLFKICRKFSLLKVKIVGDSLRILNMHAIYPMRKYCMVPELKILKDIHFALFDTKQGKMNIFEDF